MRDRKGRFFKFYPTLDYFFDKARRKIEHYVKVSEALKGRRVSDEIKEKISQSKKGQTPWNKDLHGQDYLKHFGGKMPMQGKNHPEETKRKLRDSHLGKKYGPWNEAQREKIPKALKGIKRPWLSKRNKDPAFISKVLNSLSRRPTQAEVRLIEIIEKNRLPFKYTGNGRKIIGSRCPDFINTKNPNHVVEVFGEYFHSPQLNKNVVYERTFDGTMHYYKAHGIHCTIIWDYELDDEKRVINKLGGGGPAKRLFL